MEGHCKENPLTFNNAHEIIKNQWDRCVFLSLIKSQEVEALLVIFWIWSSQANIKLSAAHVPLPTRRQIVRATLIPISELNCFPFKNLSKLLVSMWSSVILQQYWGQPTRVKNGQEFSSWQLTNNGAANKTFFFFFFQQGRLWSLPFRDGLRMRRQGSPKKQSPTFYGLWNGFCSFSEPIYLPQSTVSTTF